MGIQFKNRFSSNPNNISSANRTERPKAKYWLNVGYETGDAEYPFVSLPLGIPLDLESKVDVRGKAGFAQLCDAQNGLLEELIEMAEKLAPGDDAIISHPEMPLAFQLRHVRGEQSVDRDTNTLSRKVFAAEPAKAAAE